MLVLLLLLAPAVGPASCTAVSRVRPGATHAAPSLLRERRAPAPLPPPPEREGA